MFVKVLKLNNFVGLGETSKGFRVSSKYAELESLTVALLVSSFAVDWLLFRFFDLFCGDLERCRKLRCAAMCAGLWTGTTKPQVLAAVKTWKGAASSSGSAGCR